MTTDETGGIPEALFDVDAEMSVLGSVLNSPPVLEEIRDHLVSPADFYLPRHEIIWAAMLDMVERDEPIEAVALGSRLTKDGDITRAGGLTYLADLYRHPTTAVTGPYYAEIVAQKAASRRGWRMALQAAQAFATPDREPSVVADMLASKILDATSTSSTGTTSSIGEIHARFSDQLDAPLDEEGGVMCRWGYADGGSYLGDLRGGNIAIVAGRPGMGKSTVANDLTRHVVLDQRGTALVFSLEMTKREWWERFVSATAHVPYERIKQGECSQFEVAKIAQQQGEIDAARLFIDHEPGANLAHVRQVARRVQRKHGLSLIVVDYLQLMSIPGKHESREQAVAGLSRNMKKLAQQLEVPIVILAQLNRGPEARLDKKPTMADLRESGSLEQDADQVVLVFREDAYEKETPRAGEVDLIVDKNRHGPQGGVVTLAAQLQFARFADLERYRRPEPARDYYDVDADRDAS